MNDDTSIFLARFPSVVFGTASIVAIYFLAKKINKKVGIISCFLITFSPICVALSRFAREYQAYFLVIVLLLVYLIYLFETYDQKGIRFKSYGKLNFFIFNAH
ncbi:MAG: glycosyltransferase family 39 protein [Methanosarcinales archaeon]|nr:glycosyltransferase family 39 protein [Methanosarcinales archaeon]